jgi:predicted nuclease of restriction endonuclease-like RecB superfamily
LENARKYGLLLGSFFPAVLNLKRYTLEAEITLRSRKGKLILDEKSGLVSHYRNISAYVPEEIRLFHRSIKEKGEEWQIIGETPFINMGKEGVCFPDLSFRNREGKVCHLELFHRWHKHTFPKRLAFLEEHPETDLILGADRGAVPDDTFAALEEKYPAAAKRVFRFRDFPGVETVLRMLNKYAETSASS